VTADYTGGGFLGFKTMLFVKLLIELMNDLIDTANEQISTNLKPDIRLQTTIWIWGLSIPLLCACVPIVAITDTGITLPVLVLIAVAVGTSSVWYLANHQPNSKEPTELKQITDRIEILEAIASHDRLTVDN
jgi:hypothetical protein